MDLDQRTLQHIVDTNLIGNANLLALAHGALASEHGNALPRCYLFTRRTPDTDGPLADDPLGKTIYPNVLHIKRCDWDGGSLIEIKENGRVRFAAIPIPYTKEPTGPCITVGGERYQIAVYEPGSWSAAVQRAYSNLKQ